MGTEHIDGSGGESLSAPLDPSPLAPLGSASGGSDALAASDSAHARAGVSGRQLFAAMLDSNSNSDLEPDSGAF